jgi:hypothetical protein
MSRPASSSGVYGLTVAIVGTLRLDQEHRDRLEERPDRDAASVTT